MSERTPEQAFLYAPWTPEQVVGLNRWQQAGIVHPFTCGNDECRAVLVATPTGWQCPDCSYTQTWAMPSWCCLSERDTRMPDRLIPEHEAEIRARLAAATPGPWLLDARESWDVVVWGNAAGVVLDGPEETDSPLVMNLGPSVVQVGAPCSDREIPNGDLIAHAPEDLAVLLAEVASLRTELQAAKEGCEVLERELDTWLFAAEREEAYSCSHCGVAFGASDTVSTERYAGRSVGTYHPHCAPAAREAEALESWREIVGPFIDWAQSEAARRAAASADEKGRRVASSRSLCGCPMCQHHTEAYALVHAAPARGEEGRDKGEHDNGE